MDMNKRSLENLKLGPLKRKKPIIWNGNVYPGVVDLARELNIPPHMVYNRLHYYDIPLFDEFVDYAIEINNK